METNLNNYTNRIHNNVESGRSFSVATALRTGRQGLFYSKQKQVCFSVRHCVQTDSVVYPTPYPIRTGESSSRGKAATS